MVKNPADYLPLLRDELADVERRGHEFGLCLYNAGMDPFEGCVGAGLLGITREMLAARERFVFQWCRRRGIPIAFVIAGGYVGPKVAQPQLVDLHRLTLSAAADVTS